MPEVNVLNFKYDLLVSRFDFLKLVFILIVNGVNELLSVCKLGGVNLDLNLGICANDLRGDLDSGSAVIIKIEVSLVYTDKVDVTVNAAVEGEIGHLGIYCLVCAVVNYDSNVGGVCELAREINSPGRVAAVVMRELFSANVYVCG